ncbi:uncharacterized protein CBL_04848 [Carabus blaptoides fortunei]
MPSAFVDIRIQVETRAVVTFAIRKGLRLAERYCRTFQKQGVLQDMDVTFTNVLEGARQYFQGLPATTGSAASPTSSAVSYGSAGGVAGINNYSSTSSTLQSANPGSNSNSSSTPSTGASTTNSTQAPLPTQHSTINNHGHSRPNNESNLQYWSAPSVQHVQEQQKNNSKESANMQMHQSESVMHHQQQHQQYQHSQQQHEQLPSQSQQASNPPSSHSQPVDSAKVQQPMHSYHYQASQNHASQTYQFSRPQSHEASPGVLQYSSHYSQTTHRPVNMQPGSHSQHPQQQQQHHPSPQSASMQHMSQPRPPSRPHEQIPPSSKSQSYHQLQSSRPHHIPSSHPQSMYMNSYQQQTAKPYYPSHSQSQTSLPPSSSHSYAQPASSQAYMPNHPYTPHSYAPHSHSPVQTQTQYLSTKMTSQHANYDNTSSSKQEMPNSNHLPTSQHHRTTHNLPPIAALLSVNYHSSKSNRESSVQRLASHRHRTQAMSHASSVSTSANTTVTVPSSVSATSSQQQQQQSARVPAVQYSSSQYSTASYPPNSVANAIPLSSNSSSGSNSSSTNIPSTYPYPPTASQAFTCTTTSSTSSSSTTSSTSTNYNQSSYPHHYKKLPKGPSYHQESSSQKQQPQYQSTSSKDYPYHTASNSNRLVVAEQAPTHNMNQQQQQQQHARPENPIVAITALSAKQKRESPLDLSVKTVRTSADSTAHDESEVHSSEVQRLNNAYPPSARSMPPPMQVPPNGSYMNYEHHSSNNQRSVNIRAAPVSGGGAPKVDFLPNFNVSSLHHSQRNHNVENSRQNIPPPQTDKNHNADHAADQSKYSRNVPYNNSKVYYQHQNSYHPSTSYQHTYNNNAMPSGVHSNSYAATKVTTKRTEGLPRIDFPTPGHTSKTSAMYSNSPRDVQRKRPAEPVPSIPSKIPKMDVWRQTIDQQIEQRFSTYTKSRKQEEQQLQQQPHLHPHQSKQMNNVVPKPMINGNAAVPNHHRPRDMYMPPYPQTHVPYQQAQQPFNNNNNKYHPPQSLSHSQTYVPTAVGQHHYPPHANHPNHPQLQDVHQQSTLSRTNSNPKIPPTSPIRNNNVGGGADKRVLSILRNSLEIKGAKEAQKKLEQGQMKSQDMHANHMRSGVQQPTTDVTAPLQPKPGIVGRHNVSPFTAASLLERNSNTPPIYKFHIPRAVDSVNFEPEPITKDNPVQTTENFINKPEMYSADENNTGQNITSAATMGANSDLDGLAAFLASRIRTKAELKQVPNTQSQMQNVTNQSVTVQSESASTNVVPTMDMSVPIATAQIPISNSLSGGAPPKLTREQGNVPPRRRLFSRSEEESCAGVTAPSSSSNSACVPARDSVLRSSSETSVFDFRDSDSDGEMPVLERQSLDDMRRDRKSLHKNQQSIPVVVADGEIKMEIKDAETDDNVDPFWSETCDKLLEQLKSSGGKRRGRKKKVFEADVLAKLETVTKENPLDNINLDAVVKLENIVLVEVKEDISSEVQIKMETDTVLPVKLEDDSDSDVPLIRRKNSPVIKKEESDDEDSTVEVKREKIGAKIKIEYSSDSSDSDTETVQSLSDKLRTRKARENNKLSESDKGMVLRSADSSPSKKIDPCMKKKTIFGDGSDFHPGWEEEVYRYKRSLRMPARLINITRAPHWHRVSTSLPDLDPCSPAPSSLTDDTEFSIIQRRSMPSNFTESSNTGKLKREILDSDMDSNSSFSFSYQKASYDSEEASCSSLKLLSVKRTDTKVKNKENNNSILDVLVERYGKHKRKKMKGKDQQKTGPKIIPKATEALELLPTPSLGIGSPEKENTKAGKGKSKNNKESTKFEMTDSVYLGFFRKETVNNFRDTFKKNSGFMNMGEPFSTVVLKSRTRTETRVMKQRATIREVFGEERPASAPPFACREDENVESSQDSTTTTDEKLDAKREIQTSSKKEKENIVSPTRTGLRSSSGRRKQNIFTKKLQRGRKRGNNLLKAIATKKINSALPEATSNVKSEVPSVKSETQSNDAEDSSEVSPVPTKKRIKFRNMRRKFSSGFDYIRKKKKQVKKDAGDPDNAKPKRRGLVPRPSPESVQDIQREIKTWVMNKGVGETHLHRAARLGYTDITAYCLEKLDCLPSPKDNAGYTPLHEACSRGHLDIAKLLLQYGANVSESAQGGIRPLHEAAENGFVEIIRLLLSYGADPMLATYSGHTPLSLATDEETKSLLKHYMADVQGLPAPPWSFNGPAPCFDPEDTGYDPLMGAPSPDPVPEDEDIEIEMSEQQLPNLYTLREEPASDRWVLLQDLSMILKIKSRDTLLRQINSNVASTSSSSTSSVKSILRELKFADFMEQAHCCQLLCANEKLNVRSSKIALVKYTDKVKQLLGVERVVVTSR